MPKVKDEDVVKRFWERVDKSGEGCWPWTGSKKAQGYGTYKIKRKQFIAHRLAWAFTHGEIPDGLWCLHKCDNPPCCRPDHLYLGTRKNNCDDVTARDRHKRKLSVEQIVELRRESNAGKPYSYLAKKYEISLSLVALTARGERYQFAGGPIGKRSMKVWNYNCCQGQRGRTFKPETLLKMSIARKKYWAKRKELLPT